MAEMDAVARRHALARPHEGQPAVGRDAHVQRRVDLRRGFAAPADAGKLRRNDLGVVEDQHVAGIEQRRQVAHDAILERALRAARRAASPRRAGFRPKRDALFRQVEIEEVDAHQVETDQQRARDKQQRARHPSERDLANRHVRGSRLRSSSMAGEQLAGHQERHHRGRADAAG